MSTQARTQVRHQRILDAALSVFSARGYREAAVDDIAAAAETSKGGIYFHFPGKQAIFLALLDRTAALLLGRIRDAVEAEPEPVARLDAALLALLRIFGSHRSLARLFLVEAMGAGPEFHAKMAELYGQFAAFIRGYLDEAVRAGVIPPQDTEIASLAWFGALNQVVSRWALADRPAPLEDVYPALRALLLRSVGAEPVGQPSRAGEAHRAPGVSLAEVGR